MPLITRLFLKTGLIYFLGSLIIGIAMQVEALGIPVLMPLFWHMLMLGWITQIIMGVSMWMFPGRNKIESFSNQRWAWMSYILLNTGLVLRIICEPWLGTTATGLLKFLLVLSAILQFLGVIFYVLEIWPRVISKEKHMENRKAGK